MAGGIFVPQIRDGTAMLIVNFDKNELCKKAYGLWQYDYGQVLRIQGLSLPTAAEIHFALQETGGEAVTRIGITKDGVTDVTIPDSLLENLAAGATYEIYDVLLSGSTTSGETIRRISLGLSPGQGRRRLIRQKVKNSSRKPFRRLIMLPNVQRTPERKQPSCPEGSGRSGEKIESQICGSEVAEQVEINADLVAQGTADSQRFTELKLRKRPVIGFISETAKQSETAAREAQTAAETAKAEQQSA